MLVLVFAASAALSAVAVWASIALAHHLQFYDHPDQARKFQAEPIPRLGGVAVALTVTASTILWLGVSNQNSQIPSALSILLPAVAVAVLGYVDDQISLPPLPRLALQALIALTAWLLGTRITLTDQLWLDALIFIGWVLVIVNGINLLDNMDGLAGSTVLVGSLGATIIALSNGQELIALVGVGVAGTSLGFLRHNWHPARVYMGDSGAYFLGFLFAILAVRLRPVGVEPIAGVAIAVLLGSLPILDTSYVVVSRLRRGVHPFTPGRDHLSHVLEARGFSPRMSVSLLQLVGITGAALALLIDALPRL